MVKTPFRRSEVGQAKKKVLYICHNHPAIVPGGSEIYALELYEAMRQSDEFEPVIIARRGPSNSPQVRRGTRFSRVNADPHQYFFFTDPAEFDYFYMTARDKSLYTKTFREFLEAYRPDIVHVQHTLSLGYDLLRLIRNVLPTAPIVYTLHEYLPICHRDGQMLRTNNTENCLEESPRRCHECFPDIAPQQFFLRKRFSQSQLSVVDFFLTPSNFLLERYADWGIPREKLRFEDYGRSMLSRPTAAAEKEERPRNRFAFFGQVTPYKGVDVLLKAMKILEQDAEPCGARLSLHTANLEHQQQAFRDEIGELLEATKQNVTMAGGYFASELPKLMANIDWVVTPSIWWENAPLVIQEAFHYRRPVICSDIGGMIEKVTDGVNGLHFRVRDPLSLAHVMRQAIKTQGLWESLREGIPEVYMMSDHVASLTNIYRTLIEQKSANKESYAR